MRMRVATSYRRDGASASATRGICATGITTVAQCLRQLTSCEAGGPLPYRRSRAWDRRAAREFPLVGGKARVFRPHLAAVPPQTLVSVYSGCIQCRYTIRVY